MTDVGSKFYESIGKYSDLEELIQNGEAEGLYLECKSPLSPDLNREMKTQLATALSGFGNTEGGIIIYGMSTTPKKHGRDSLDVLTQIEPIGACRRFAQQIQKSIPLLTTPPITNFQIKEIYEKTTDKKGIIVVYSPKHIGDPIQSNSDYKFYFRNGDEFKILPYELLNRLFAETERPNLVPSFLSDLGSTNNNLWKIPIGIKNESSAVGEHVVVQLETVNASSFEEIIAESFRDMSRMNPGKKLFFVELNGVAHRGIRNIMGTLHVKIKRSKRPRRTLHVIIRIFANKMRARVWYFDIQLTTTGFKTKLLKDTYLY
jgi:hypothetical protein